MNIISIHFLYNFFLIQYLDWLRVNFVILKFNNLWISDGSLENCWNVIHTRIETRFISLTTIKFKVCPCKRCEFFFIKMIYGFFSEMKTVQKLPREFNSRRTNISDTKNRRGTRMSWKISTKLERDVKEVRIFLLIYLMYI